MKERRVIQLSTFNETIKETPAIELADDEENIVFESMAEKKKAKRTKLLHSPQSKSEKV